ncbi:MAG: hypothetical protein ABSC42_08140 [Tepidisphaeraceae bacterium]|jgi:hypothetical protein
MTSDQFRTYWKAAPFTPFRIHLADGRSLKVPHPDYAQLSPTGRIASVWDIDGNAFETIDLLLVTSLKPLPAKKNGKQQRR